MSLVPVEIESNPPRTAEAIQKTEEVHEDSGGIFNAALENQYLPEARLHIWSVHIEGSWVSQLRNTGRLPLFRTQMQNYRAELADEPGVLSHGNHTAGFLPRGNGYNVKNDWNIGGAIGTLWSIMNIFFTGSVAVQENVHVQALGFSKTISLRSRVPVGSVSVRWDAD